MVAIRQREKGRGVKSFQYPGEYGDRDEGKEPNFSKKKPAEEKLEWKELKLDNGGRRLRQNLEKRPFKHTSAGEMRKKQEVATHQEVD